MAEVTTKQSNIRRQFGNRVILLAVVAALMVIPTYVGVAPAFVMYYGDAYFAAVYNPHYLFEQYMVLFNYWLQYRAQLPQDFTLKVIGPPAGGIFGSLLLLYMARAPLMDFRPFKYKESIHGDAHWATE